MTPATFLRDRAESYARDAIVLRADGDTVWCQAFRAIADELRSVANDVEAEQAKS